VCSFGRNLGGEENSPPSENSALKHLFGFVTYARQFLIALSFFSFRFVDLTTAIFRTPFGF
jgi:hypothetical protein